MNNTRDSESVGNMLQSQKGSFKQYTSGSFRLFGPLSEMHIIVQRRLNLIEQ